MLKHKVPFGQGAVGLTLTGKGSQLCICLKGQPGKVVGRTEPYASLVVVVLEYHEEAHHLKECEDKPIMVLLEKLYEIAHGKMVIS